jgi:hypothetical protein
MATIATGMPIQRCEFHADAERIRKEILIRRGVRAGKVSSGITAGIGCLTPANGPDCVFVPGMLGSTIDAIHKDLMHGWLHAIA